MSGKVPTIPACLGALMKVFDTHAAQDPIGPKDKLSKKELKKLMETEMGGMLGEKIDDARVNDMFSLMDMDEDGQVDFEEFMMIMACFACACKGRDFDMKCKK